MRKAKNHHKNQGDVHRHPQHRDNTDAHRENAVGEPNQANVHVDFALRDVRVFPVENPYYREAQGWHHKPDDIPDRTAL